MKEKTCCFTGHRIIPKSEYQYLQNQLEQEIKALIRQDFRYFGTDGAL